MPRSKPPKPSGGAKAVRVWAVKNPAVGIYRIDTDKGEALDWVGMGESEGTELIAGFFVANADVERVRRYRDSQQATSAGLAIQAAVDATLDLLGLTAPKAGGTRKS